MQKVAVIGAGIGGIAADFLRHSNKQNKLRCIYFVGGSVHPGGGIHLCLASAKVVANQIPDCYDPA